jgi:hypothetical protein
VKAWVRASCIFSSDGDERYVLSIFCISGNLISEEWCGILIIYHSTPPKIKTRRMGIIFVKKSD